MPNAAADHSIVSVRDAILSATGPNPEDFFQRMIRQAIDEVIDGGRTGRWLVKHLDKTEKTYIGTKMEIIVRNDLELKRGDHLDLKIAGREVDVKMTIGKNWMIPTEALGEICLLLQGNEDAQLFAVGLLRMTDDNVTKGGNKDKKVSVSANGRNNTLWLVPPSPLPNNFLATLSDVERRNIFAKGKGQGRVTELLRHVTGRIIPRLTIETLAQQKDPMKRVRSNGGAADELLAEGIVVLVGDWKKHRKVAIARGLPEPKGGELIAIKTTIPEARAIRQSL